MQKIDKIWAFVALDPLGNEGLTAHQTVDGWMPLVAADIARVQSLKELAQSIANLSGQTITLREFSVAQDIEEIKPKPP